MLRKILVVIAILIAVVVSGGYWVYSLIPERDLTTLKATQADDLPYLVDGVTEHRGRILAVVTSVDQFAQSGKETGYELTELARAYWVFHANGFEVDIASPKGGTPPMIIDDMGPYDYAFLNDVNAQAKTQHTLAIDAVDPSAYEAVYFVGGKGAMFDFPDNAAIKHLVKSLYQNGKVVSAVCHGPAALVNVRLDDGRWLVADKKVTAFTNNEELFLMPDAEKQFPFLLQSKLAEQGANFEAGTNYLEQVSKDGKLLTGQNPWSVWTLAEEVVTALGYPPVPRAKTPEERSIELLETYQEFGYAAAKQTSVAEPGLFARGIVLMHGIVALMQWEIRRGIDLLLLANALKH